MEESANTQIRDKTIAHIIYLQRYYSSTSKQVMDLLRVVEKDLVKQLKTLDIDNQMTIPQIDARLESVRAILNEGYDLAGKELIKHMNDAAEYEQEWQIKTIDDSTPIVLDMVAVAPVTLFAAIESKPLQGKLIKEWIDKLDQDSYERIQDAVRIGLVEGQSYSDVVKRITGTKALQYTDGVMALNNRQAQALVSTAMSHATNTATSEFYQANDDLIKGWQFLATLDFRTTTLCKSYDGQKFELGKGPYPPIHIRCRSSTVPVLKSWKEMGMKDPPAGTRSSLDGQISETINYDEWLRKQSHEKQNEALGVGKAEIFRSGVKLDRFVENGKELTLDELKKKEGIKLPEKTPAKAFVPAKIKLDNSTFSNGLKKDEYESALNKMHPSLVEISSKLDKPKEFGWIKGSKKSSGYYKNRSTYLNSQTDEEVLFHEYGHHVDNMLGLISLKDKGFVEAFIADGTNLKITNFENRTEIMKKFNNDFFNIETVEKKGLKYRTRIAKEANAVNLADIYDAMTSGRIHKENGIGHGVSYYKRAGAKQSETFANLFSLRGSNMWTEVEKQLPNLAKRFDEIIAEQLKK